MRLSNFAILLLSWTISFPQSAAPNIAGDWIFQIEQQRVLILATRLQLSVSDGKIAGKAGSAVVRGNVSGSDVALELLGQNLNVDLTLTGRHEAGRLSGTAKSPDGLAYTWNAEREAARPTEVRVHDFSPSEFQRYFSPATPPVLRISPGDTVRTSSGDAGGVDASRATTGMARYLETEHGLNSNEAAVVMGFAIRYDIADLVGTQVSIVAKLPKITLAQLPPRKP